MQPCSTTGARSRRVYPVALILIAALILSQCTVHHQLHASARLVLLETPRPTAACHNVCANLLPNPYPPSSSLLVVLASAARNHGFRRNVVVGGGTGGFTLRAQPVELDVQTSSSKREDANKTLTVVVGLLTKQFAELQTKAGASPTAQLVVATRSDA